MTIQTEQSAQDYLEQHMEPEFELTIKGHGEEKKQEEWYKRLDTFLGTPQIQNNIDGYFTNRVIVEGKDTSLMFDYGPREDTRSTDFRKHHSELQSLFLTNREGEELSINSITPSEYHILFIQSPKEGEINNVNIETKAITITDDLLKPKVILGLLHGIGQARKLVSLSEGEQKELVDIKERSQRMEDVSFQEMEKLLRAERDAWAFALKSIKPFLNDTNFCKEDVLKYIHDSALRSYSDGLKLQFHKKGIPTDADEKIQQFYNEMMGEFEGLLGYTSRMSWKTKEMIDDFKRLLSQKVES